MQTKKQLIRMRQERDAKVKAAFKEQGIDLDEKEPVIEEEPSEDGDSNESETDES